MVNAIGYEFAHLFILIVIGISVVVANTIMLALLYQNRSNSSPFSVLLVSLGLSSLIIGIITPLQPGYFVGTYSIFRNKENLCNKLKWMDIIFLTATGAKILSLTAITAERYRSTTQLTKYSSISTKATAVGVVVIWAMSILYNCIVYAKVQLDELNVSLENPTMNHITTQLQITIPINSTATGSIATGGGSSENFITFCYYKSATEGEMLVIVHALSLVLFYVGPFACIVFMFARMFILLRRLSSKVNTDSIYPARVCTTKAMSAIVFLFLIVWIPGHIFQIEILGVDDFVRRKKLSKINFKWRLLHDMALGTVCSESFFYVVIYLLFVHNFLGQTVEVVKKNLKRRFTEFRLDLLGNGDTRGSNQSAGEGRRDSVLSRLGRLFVANISSEQSESHA